MGANFQAKPISLISILCSMIFLLIFFTIPSSVSAGNNNTLSAYDVVQQYDFPVGILPEGVTGYELDNSTGNFKVHLNGTCTFKALSYELKYKPTIIGVITRDNISNLEGIVIDMWLNIVGLTRDPDNLTILTGLGSSSFPISNFGTSPKCD